MNTPLDDLTKMSDKIQFDDKSESLVIRLVILLLIAFVSMLIGAGLMQILGYGELITNMSSDPMDMNQRNEMRFVVGINQFFTFTLTGIVFAIYVYREKIFKQLQLPSQRMEWLLPAIGLILFSIPLVALTNWLNHQIPLPDILNSMEDSTGELIKQLLKMENTGELLFNLFLIGVLPGVGEELIFRGIIQKEIEQTSRKPWLAILVTAAIFSAIHFQFAGFLPRMFLGVILGFVYWRTRNLWIPILAHVLFNSMQVIGAYSMPEMMEEMGTESVSLPPTLSIIASVLIVGGLIYYFLNNTNPAALSRKAPSV